MSMPNLRAVASSKPPLEAGVLNRDIARFLSLEDLVHEHAAVSSSQLVNPKAEQVSRYRMLPFPMDGWQVSELLFSQQSYAD